MDQLIHNSFLGTSSKTWKVLVVFHNSSLAADDLQQFGGVPVQLHH